MLGLFDLVVPRPGGCCCSSSPSAARRSRAEARGVAWRDATSSVAATAAPPGVRACVVVGRRRRRRCSSYDRFFREEPAPYFASDEDHFLFGSIGTEGSRGRAVLDLAGAAADLSRTCCPAPGGYASLGLRRQGRPRDAGRALEGHGRVPARRHQLRHVPHGQLPAAARRSADDRRRRRRRTRRRRSSTCGSCSLPRPIRASTPTRILGEIAKNTRLSLIDRLLYRFAIIPAYAPGAAAAARRAGRAGCATRPDWGRGRIDPFNPVKFRMLRQPMDDDHRQLRHGAGVEPRAAQRLGVSLGRPEHRRCARSCCRRRSATAPRMQWVDRDVAHWDDADPRTDVEPAPHHELHAARRRRRRIPLPIDQALAAAGASACTRRSARRATPPAARAPARSCRVAEVGTDRHRLDMWTTASATAYNAYGEGHAWKFSTFRHDRRLRRRAARRPVAARPVSCTTARCRRWPTCSSRRRRARSSSGAATTCYDPVARRLRHDRPRGPARRARSTTRRGPATATPATPTARHCPPPPSAPCWST